MLRSCYPLATLPMPQFERLCAGLQLEDLSAGEYLFRAGASDDALYYLVRGAVKLQTESLLVETVKAGSDSGRFAVAHYVPRKVNAVADGAIRFVRLNATMIIPEQHYVEHDSDSAMMVDDAEDSDDWMTTLLKSPIFSALPPANLQKILIGLQEIHVKSGEVIINQGDVGDYYYIIKTGQCAITRKPSPNAKDIRLGQLGDLDTFGEDALISGQPRNVTISAASDVVLLRLDKAAFISLIKQPCLKFVEHTAVAEWQEKGAMLIDVRDMDEYGKTHLPGSVNVPFFSLRMQLKNFSRQQPIMVICKDGKTSETAAFVLMRHRFSAMIVRGGMQSIQPAATPVVEKAVEPVAMATVAPSVDAVLPRVDNSGATDEALLKMYEKLKRRNAVLEAENKALEEQCASLMALVSSLREQLRAAED